MPLVWPLAHEHWAKPEPRAKPTVLSLVAARQSLAAHPAAEPLQKGLGGKAGRHKASKTLVVNGAGENLVSCAFAAAIRGRFR